MATIRKAPPPKCKACAIALHSSMSCLAVAGIAAKDHSLVGRQESVVYQPTAQAAACQLQTRAQGGAFPRPALRCETGTHPRRLPADATGSNTRGAAVSGCALGRSLPHGG